MVADTLAETKAVILAITKGDIVIEVLVVRLTKAVETLVLLSLSTFTSACLRAIW